jgi:hypothetical protein
MTNSANWIRWAVASAIGIALLNMPNIALAGHGGPSIPNARKTGTPSAPTTTPPTTGNGSGEIVITGKPGGAQKGFEPLTLTPIGAPGTPLPPASESDKVKQVILSALANIDVDTTAADELAEKQAVRAVMQDRDVRLASKMLPKHIVVAVK